ncbi:hypothetical protein [Nannocystis bainbridge]|uniref:VWFA domain-containing protein n=1 Tax=Nannocystis bainbridge TaxID=2995303 RepID=A0ABT5E6S6_9BACT|nr:hypothetical protein [Nannocystis bainbridge]MDC0720512.1 hypothetical protein [Nannocystis bainbridge]
MRALALTLITLGVPCLSACSDDGGGGGTNASAGPTLGGLSNLTLPGDTSTTGGTDGTGTNPTTTTGVTDANPSEPATTDDSGSAPKFDIGEAPDGGLPPVDTGCKKVDLLFVIDNSGSMADEQINLVNSFPDFVSEMQTQLMNTDSYHVGVVSSDSNVYNGAGCQMYGGLINRTGGASSSNATCTPYAGGKNWMSETDDLGSKFACAGQVGTGGDGNEQPMYAMLQAVQPQFNGPGACNDGFIREDALLVVVLITDEEDDHEVQACQQLPQSGSPGEPGDWYTGLVAAKGNVETNIVVLSLIGPVNPTCPALDKCNGGITGAELSSRIVQFTEMFTNGFVGQICAPSYKQFFSQAIGLIDEACENFMPPG